MIQYIQTISKLSSYSMLSLIILTTFIYERFILDVIHDSYSIIYVCFPFLFAVMCPISLVLLQIILISAVCNIHFVSDVADLVSNVISLIFFLYCLSCVDVRSYYFIYCISVDAILFFLAE